VQKLSALQPGVLSADVIVIKGRKMDVIEQFVTPGLGDNSYLMVSDGEAVLVDPQRDAWRFLEIADRMRVRIRYVLETHVHNDYVSGALEVRAATGAEIAVSARGAYAFPHRACSEGDELQVGALRLAPMETPGHTPEHLVWRVYDGDRLTRVFTGGSLLVGSAGRTDLLGSEQAETLARAQFRTLRRLAALADEVEVLPTHGAGSFCSVSSGAMARTSTIGAERMSNPVLGTGDEEDFVRAHLAGRLAYPNYYRHMAQINRSGPHLLGGRPTAVALSADAVASKVEQGVAVVDARERRAFAADHLPGSINVELDSSFGTYVGWVLPFNARLVLILPEPTEPAASEAVVQLLRIGYERVEGFLDRGLVAWRDSGRPTRSYPVGNVNDLCHRFLTGERITVLDVRQQAEWAAGRVPDSIHIFIGDLPIRMDEVPREGVVWTVCASGYRASIAASMLDRAGVPVHLLADGGVPEWLARCFPVQSGPE
jgi:hydroxyacylglutathione hydrolase